MKPPRKYQLPQPARRTDSASLPETGVAFPTGSAAGPPVTLLPGSPAPDVLVGYPMPRLRLRVVLTLVSDTDAPRTALAAANFASRVITADRRLRLSVDTARSSATGGELVLTFVLGRWGFFESQWVEEVKPAVRELAAAFEGAEVKSVEVVKEE